MAIKSTSPVVTGAGVDVDGVLANPSNIERRSALLLRLAGATGVAGADGPGALENNPIKSLSSKAELAGATITGAGANNRS